MAESVDALVSNTSGAIRAGSIPAPGTEKRILTARVLFSISNPLSKLLGLPIDMKVCQNRGGLAVYRIMRLLHGAALQG